MGQRSDPQGSFFVSGKTEDMLNLNLWSVSLLSMLGQMRWEHQDVKGAHVISHGAKNAVFGPGKSTQAHELHEGAAQAQRAPHICARNAVGIRS